ncbi:MAG: hypothetical protein Q7J76_08840 [Candidatus Brocadiaceae bacterium]|nr:hypothetical protein [Candidatus Brocadiaceae bacterium]
MSLAVDEPILNDPFEAPREYWVYDELSAVNKNTDSSPGGLKGVL